MTEKRWRHKKRGSTYVEVGCARLQSSDPTGLADMQLMIVYRSETDGSLWVRPDYEFADGRFEPIAQDEATEANELRAALAAQSQAGNARLEAIEKAARHYFMSYLRDEAEERELCFSDEHHASAVALREALSHPSTEKK
jgi:hypothetical protein